MGLLKNRSAKINRRKLLNFLSKLQIKILNFSLPQLLILIGIIIIVSSLFTPWFSLFDKSSYGAFSQITGISGYLSLIVIIVNIFVIFSQNIKHKLKLSFHTFIEDSILYIVSSSILLLMGLHTLISLGGLKIISSEVHFHSGIILFLLGNSIYFLGAILYVKRKKYSNHQVYINDSPNQRDKRNKEGKNVTKLPF